MDCFMLFLFVWPVLETSSTGRMHCKAEQVNQRAWKDKTMDTSWAFSKVIRKRDMAASTPSLTGFNSVRPLLFYWLPAVAYWMSFDQRSLWWLPFWWTYFSIGFFFSRASSLVACSYPIRVCVLLVCDRLACLLAINWGCSLPLAWAPLIPSWVYFLSSLFYVVMSWIRSIPYNFVHSYLLSYSYSCLRISQVWKLRDHLCSLGSPCVLACWEFQFAFYSSKICFLDFLLLLYWFMILMLLSRDCPIRSRFAFVISIHLLQSQCVPQDCTQSVSIPSVRLNYFSVHDLVVDSM